MKKLIYGLDSLSVVRICGAVAIIMVWIEALKLNP